MQEKKPGLLGQAFAFLNPNSCLLGKEEMQSRKEREGSYKSLTNNGFIMVVLEKKFFFFIFANLKYFREVYEHMKHRVKRSLEYTHR